MRNHLGRAVLLFSFTGILLCAVRAGDAKEGAQSLTLDLKGKDHRVFFLSFAGGKKAEIWVESELKTDVDLYVYDLTKKRIAQDKRIDKDCHVAFTPEKTQYFMVIVVNVGSEANRGTLKFTGQEAKFKTSQQQPFDIEEDQKKVFEITFSEGKLAQIWVDCEKKSDIDLFVFDAQGKRVADDTRLSSECHVAFVPEKTQAYRVEVLNLGAGNNRCTIKHTVADEK